MTALWIALAATWVVVVCLVGEVLYQRMEIRQLKDSRENLELWRRHIETALREMADSLKLLRRLGQEHQRELDELVSWKARYVEAMEATLLMRDFRFEDLRKHVETHTGEPVKFDERNVDAANAIASRAWRKKPKGAETHDDETSRDRSSDVGVCVGDRCGQLRPHPLDELEESEAESSDAAGRDIGSGAAQCPDEGESAQQDRRD